MIWSILSPCPECGERYLDNNSEDSCVCVTGQDCAACSDAERWECSSCGAVFEYSYETHRFELNSVPDSEEEEEEEDSPLSRSQLYQWFWGEELS